MSRGVTWLGHATVLLEIGGVRVLTDPLLRRRVAYLVRRVPPIPPASLGRVDVVLISHAHRDHLDPPTLRALDGDPAFVTPRGVGRHLRGLGDVHELAAGERVAVGGVEVTATGAVHRAFRGGRRLPALGYVVDSDLYFAGDTDLFAGMRDLAPLTLALLPIWGWGTTLGPGHLDPHRAADAVELLRPDTAVPIHWGTYLPVHVRDSAHPLMTWPPATFTDAVGRCAPRTEVVVLAPGERLALADGHGV